MSKLGINPRDDHSVALGYGCLRLLERIVKINGWRFSFAAYKNESNHNLLSRLFPETVQSIDQRLDSPDYWKEFNEVYSQAGQVSFPDFIRNLCPNFVTTPDECISLLNTGTAKKLTILTDENIDHCLQTMVNVQCRYAESSEQAYITYQEKLHQAGLIPFAKDQFFKLFSAANCYSISSAPKTHTSSNASHAISLFNSRLPHFNQFFFKTFTPRLGFGD